MGERKRPTTYLNAFENYLNILKNHGSKSHKKKKKNKKYLVVKLDLLSDGYNW